jgi:O-antigen/teichoic acid export membrane protein
VSAEAPGVAEASLARRAGVGMALAQASKVIELALGVGIALLAVRALGPGRFGAYSLLTNLAGAASVFLPVVTVDALGALLPRLRRRPERLYLAALVVALRSAAILGASAAVLASWGSLAPHLGLGGVPRGVALLAAVYWLCQDLLNALVAYHGAAIELRAVVVWRALGLGATLAALAGVVAAGRVSVGAVLAVVAGGSLLAAAGLAFRLRGEGAPRSPGRATVGAALGLTRSTWLIGLLSFVLATQIDVLLVGGLTHDRREAAFYAAAVGVIGRAQYLLLSGWASLVIPVFGHARTEGGDAALRRAWRAVAQLSLLVAVPVSALLLANAVPLTRLLFGRAFAPAGGLLRWVALFSLASAFLVGSPVASAYWAKDRTRTLARLRLVSGAANLALAVPLIRADGALGAVIATGAAAVLAGVLELGFARRLGVTAYPTRLAATVGVAGLAAMAPGLALEPRGAGALAASVLAGAALFLAVLVAAKPFGPADAEGVAAVNPSLGRIVRRSLVRA